MSITSEQPALPTERDNTLARAGLELLNSGQAIILKLEGQDDSLTLSPSVVGLLQRIFEEMAQGKAVDVVSLGTELSTQQAAEVLNVSRPFVIKLLDSGVLPHRLVGTHRRVLQDVLEHKETMQRQSREAMRELTELSQKMDLY